MTRLPSSLILLVCAAAATATAGVSFVEPSTILAYGPEGGGASAVVKADFNGDGKLDIAVSENPVIPDVGTRPALTVLIGNGDGTFKTPLRIQLPLVNGVDNSAGSLAAKDFDGDGKSDVVVAVPGASVLYFFKGRGDGTFNDAVAIASTRDIDGIQVADLNGDGKPDIVGTNYNASKVSVHLNSGGGTFLPAVQLNSDVSPRVIQLADVNGDGKIDILVGCYDARSVNVYLNNGSGVFPATPAQFAANIQVFGMYYADFDGDGKGDLAIFGFGGDNTGGNALGYMKGDGRGTFATPDPKSFQPTEEAPAMFYGELVATDLNGDGKADIILGHSRNVLTIALSLGNGTFDLRDIAMSGGPGFEKNRIGQIVGPEGSGCVSALVADFNGDGKLDIVAAGYGPGNGRVSLIFGVGGGNFASPRSFATITSRALYGGLDTNTLAVADVNGDGKLDLVTFSGSGQPSTTLIHVALGNGDGTFSSRIIESVGNLPAVGLTSIAAGRVADMNGDGKADLVVAANVAGIQGNSGTGATFVLYGNGDGTFGSPLRIDPERKDPQTDNQWTPVNVFVADVNGDGKPDIVSLIQRYAISGDSGYHLEVYLQNGGGFTRSFSLANSDLGRIDTGVALAAYDVDGDGKVDLIAEGSGPADRSAVQTIKFFRGKGDGTFGPLISGPAPNVNGNGPLITTEYRVGDFNRDGKPDLVVGGYNVAVYLGSGSFNFLPPTDYYSTGNNIASIDLGDFDGDGNVDIAYGQEGGGFSVLLGNNDGTFSLSNMFAVGQLAIRAVRAADLNGDGKLDAVVFHDAHGATFDYATVLINNSTKPVQQPLNISTRLAVQTGDNVLIGGFIITGNDPKKVVIRALGPSLAGNGVQGALADTTLELFDSNSQSLQFNDNWKDSQQAEIQATGIPPSNDLESAILRTLAPGNYTAVVRGKANATGVAIVEIYDLSTAANSKLANISTRGPVQTGDNVMIGGFIVGSTSKYIVRAIGPSLAKSGISDVLLDPTLELHNASGTLVSFNDNWKDTQPGEIAATGIPPNDDRESAIVAPLTGGNYTAVVRGKNGTGVALVEVFNLQ